MEEKLYLRSKTRKRVQTNEAKSKRHLSQSSWSVGVVERGICCVLGVGEGGGEAWQRFMRERVGSRNVTFGSIWKKGQYTALFLRA